MADLVLVGAGGMAQMYIPILNSMGVDFDVVCRADRSAVKFHEETGKKVIAGGVAKYLASVVTPLSAIVAVEAESLFSVTCDLLRCGVKKILVEKPAALYGHELIELKELEREMEAKVFVAYNRRFFSSIDKLHELVVEDGGISSLSFDFTEWSDKIAPLKKGGDVKGRWVISNSSHVIDLAFHLIGKPKELVALRGGGFDWHPVASNFVGCGMSEQNILFNYRANWDSAGRWGLLVYTKNFMFRLSPMEKLFLTRRNSTAEVEVKLNDSLDLKYKPGLYLQVEQFLSTKKNTRLPSITEHGDMFDIYLKIAGYDN